MIYEPHFEKKVLQRETFCEVKVYELTFANDSLQLTA